MCTLLCAPHSLHVCRRWPPIVPPHISPYLAISPHISPYLRRRWPPIAREELRQSVDVLLRNSKLASYPKVRTRGRGSLAWATLTLTLTLA